MKRISKRSDSVDSSGIRRVFELARSLKQPVNLSIGQPDFDVAPEFKEQLKTAVCHGLNSYTVSQGIPELLSSVRAQYKIENNPDLGVLITSGVSGGLFLSYMALLDPGDEVLFADPYFCMYRDLALMLNATPRYFDTYPDFRVRADRVEAALTDRTKVLVLNSPANPTGIALSEREAEEISDLAERRGLWVIYDEIYRTFCYDAPHTEWIGRNEKSIILNGYSKSTGATGWRVGLAIGPQDVIDAMTKLQQYTFVCAPSASQYGLINAPMLECPQTRDAYRKKRDFVVKALEGEFNLVLPDGAFYVFVEAPGGSGVSFVEKCIKRELLVVPGNVFSRRDSHFRISFAAKDEVLSRGVEILSSISK